MVFILDYHSTQYECIYMKYTTTLHVFVSDVEHSWKRKLLKAIEVVSLSNMYIVIYGK